HQAVRDERVNIRGTNPAKSAIQGALPHDVLRQIACQESQQRQFASAMDPCPLWSADHLGGVGIFQITVPQPSADQAWKWTENVSAGISKFTSSASVARNYPGLVRNSQQFRDLVTAYNAIRAQSHPPLQPLVRVDIPAFTEGDFDANLLQVNLDGIRGFNGFGGPAFLGIPRGALHEYRLVLDANGNLVLNVNETTRVGTAAWEQVPVADRGTSGDPNYVNNVLASQPTCP